MAAGMPAGPVTMLKVNIFDVTRQGTVTITATNDPDDVSVSKYSARNNPPADLVAEVFAKVLANVKQKTAVQLQIDDQGFIVRDPNFVIPGADARRSASAAVSPATTMKTASSGRAVAAKAAKVSASAKEAPKKETGPKKGKRPKKRN